jgi:hypothetical protein
MTRREQTERPVSAPVVITYGREPASGAWAAAVTVNEHRTLHGFHGAREAVALAEELARGAAARLDGEVRIEPAGYFTVLGDWVPPSRYAEEARS